MRTSRCLLNPIENRERRGRARTCSPSLSRGRGKGARGKGKRRAGKRRDKNLAAHPKNGRGLMFNPRVNGACLGETVRLRFTLSLLLSPIYDTPYAPQFIVPSSDIKERSLSENARERSLARAPIVSFLRVFLCVFPS